MWKEFVPAGFSVLPHYANKVGSGKNKYPDTGVHIHHLIWMILLLAPINVIKQHLPQDGAFLITDF